MTIRPLSPAQSMKMDARRRKMVSLQGELTDMMRASINCGSPSVETPRFQSLLRMFEGYRLRVEEMLTDEDKYVRQIAQDAVKDASPTLSGLSADDVQEFTRHVLLAAKVLR